MKSSIPRVLFLALLFVGGAWAATKTVLLSVPGMTCPVCPITVRKALVKVPGVESVKVDFPRKEARVVYNDSKTNVRALEKATAQAGYPSSVKKQ